MTARLAIEIKNLPHWMIDWTDTTPQRDPATLTISDLLPSEADGQELNKQAVQHIMSFLVEEFSSISYLAALIPPEESPHKTCKSTIVPMKILFKDEKYKSETTDILDRLVVDAQLSGKPEVTVCTHAHDKYKHVHFIMQIVIGDQLTCKIIRGARRWRESDITRKDRLEWALEVPG